MLCDTSGNSVIRVSAAIAMFLAYRKEKRKGSLFVLKPRNGQREQFSQEKHGLLCPPLRETTARKERGMKEQWQSKHRGNGNKIERSGEWAGNR